MEADTGRPFNKFGPGLPNMGNGGWEIAGIDWLRLPEGFGAETELG